MSNKPDSKEKIITIEAELPISLDELTLYALKHKEDKSRLFDLLYNKPETVNIKIKKIIKEIICNKKLNIKIKKLKFDYNDSEDFVMGISYFNVKLEGTAGELQKIAGENKICGFEWNEK